MSAREQMPMLATLGTRPFSDPDWLFEVKYDGVRVLAERTGGEVALFGRRGQRVTSRYPEVAEALGALSAARFVLDGEVVALDGEGRPSFQRLQPRMHVSRPADVARLRAIIPVRGVFFDALALEGHDLRALPLVQRKALLARLLPARGVVSYGDHVREHGEAFFAAAEEHRLEGIVAKRGASAYRGGRTRDWVKIKCQQRQAFVIGGYTDPKGARARFGALHLGLYAAGALVYVSRVGTGFDGGRLEDLWARLTPLRRTASPFAVGSPRGRGHHWVEPSLVAEVRFTEWTDDGGIRHPTFLGLRDDKRPEECRREVPAAISPPAS
ncbi:MAG TPA: non-homologous end-joining DNA ligase [Candidatus Binatia bacterium]|nr:non-homologous end-joining DNA ligase [Candidatus Binatia bacterium]